MASINGKDVLVKISSDGGTTFKTVVCSTEDSIDISSNPTTVATKCGSKTSAGVPEWSVNVAGVVETAPAGTETSFEDMLGYINAGTSLKVKVESPTGTGTDFHITGDVVLSNLNISLPAEGFATFTGTLSGNSAIDITP